MIRIAAQNNLALRVVQILRRHQIHKRARADRHKCGCDYGAVRRCDLHNAGPRVRMLMK